MWDALAELIKSYLVKAATGLVGWRAWLANFLIKNIMKFLKILFTYLDTKHEVKVELEKYKKVLNDPNSTADDIRNAAPDFLK